MPSNRVKILVRVKTNVGEYSKVKKTEPNGKRIVMQKAKKNRGEWHFDFKRASLYFSRKWSFFPVPFPKRMLTVDVFQNSLNAVDYDFDNEKIDKMPLFDKDQAQHFLDVGSANMVIEGEKYPLPSLFWIMLFMMVLNVGITFYLGYRIGIF